MTARPATLPKIMKRIIAQIPNSITCLNLLSGCIAIIFAFKAMDPIAGLYGWQWCAIAIGAAAVFDFCDGACARLLKAYSNIGAELDSLSDLISFGVAPAMMMLNICLHYATDSPLCYAALAIPVFGALRLARFNVSDVGKTTFRGLPIPANAIFWIGVAGWIDQYQRLPGGPVALAVLFVLFGLTMVSHIPMFSLKFKNFALAENFRRYVIILATIAFVITYGVSGLAWSIILYLMISLLARKGR